MSKKPVALVTGASKGIGAAIAVELSRQGYDIWLNYRSDDAGASTIAAEIERLGGACSLLCFDVANAEAVASGLESLLAEETPEVLVNNAGFARDGLMALMSETDWQSVLDVHLGGFFHVTRQLLPAMLKRRRGRIINIVSTSGETGVPGQVNYSAAKAGLIGATRSLAAEVARRKILVNAVSPGFIETEMTTDIPKERVLPMIPMGRFGTAEEVAAVTAFLCSPAAAYITGQVLSVNGGAYM
ncbi:MAG: 3-oxoacyl-ACP reductase FabG [Desulfuromonas sp.]|nr:MAG: 3-oxoacyl-ACP reductase FabG [Desulfuromonas sp.]